MHALHRFSMTLSSATPDLEHFVTDETLSDAVAKKSLVDWPQKKAFTDNSLLMFRGISKLATTHQELGPSFNLEEYFYEPLRVANSVFATCRKVVTLAAHLEVVYVESESQKLDAQKILDNKSVVLYKSVREALEGVVKHGARKIGGRGRGCGGGRGRGAGRRA